MLMNMLILNLILGFVLIIMGFYFKKKALFASLAGSLIILIVGISLFGSGVSYVSGTLSIVTAPNVTQVNDVYSNTVDNTVTMFSWSLLLIGFAGFVGSAMGLNKLRFESDELDDNNF